MNDVVHDDSTGRDFHVGGQDRNLSEAEQLEQLSWYIHEHHPMPTAPADKDAWLARLPDRLTHAAMLMLGAAVDHAMPGVAFTQGVEVQELPEFAAVMFIPQQPDDRQRWAVSLSPGLSAFALDNAWRPEVAAAANLSGTTIIDVSDPSKAALRHRVRPRAGGTARHRMGHSGISGGCLLPRPAYRRPAAHAARVCPRCIYCLQQQNPGLPQ